jgi:hypothetical protein
MLPDDQVMRGKQLLLRPDVNMEIGVEVVHVPEGHAFQILYGLDQFSLHAGFVEQRVKKEDQDAPGWNHCCSQLL